jgi:hypothetical protein
MIDYSKPVRTKGSKSPVRILATDVADPEYPVLGLARTQSGRESPVSWAADGAFVARSADGRSTNGHPLDLENVPVKKKGWVNLYPCGNRKYPASASGVFNTREEADGITGAERLTCVEVEWEEPAR